MNSLSPSEAAALRAREPDVGLLDVREPFEYELCRLPGSVHVPLGELVRRVDELDLERAWIVVCHHGVRSARAAAFLEQRGCERVYNLSGGIDRWSLEVDPTLPRYR